MLKRFLRDILAEFKINGLPERTERPFKGVLAGYDVSNLLKQKIGFPVNDWRSKLILGPSGCGKTTWGENYVLNCDHGVCFLDNTSGKGVDRIIERLDRDYIVLDHSDMHYPLPVGVFKKTDDVFSNDLIVDQWIDFFISNFGIEDQYMTQELIAYSCKAAFEMEKATIYDVVRLVMDQGYRNHILANVRDKDTREWWDRFECHSLKEQQRISESFLRRAGIIFRNKFLKVTLGQIPKRELEYKKWMDEGKTVLIKIPENKLGRLSVRIIASLHMLAFYQAALSRGEGGRQFTIVADEPQNWLSKNADRLDDIFSKARKYGMNIICLFQSTEQVRKESPALLKIIMDNEPDIIQFHETGYRFDAKISGREYENLKAPGIKKKIQDVVINREYNRHYQEVENEIERRIKLWAEGPGMKEKKSGLRKNGLKGSVNPDSRTETGRSSGSSIYIE